MDQRTLEKWRENDKQRPSARRPRGFYFGARELRLITLTEPNGDPFEVDADQISELVPNNLGAFAKAAKTIVTMQNGHQHAVKETMEHISSLVKVK